MVVVIMIVIIGGGWESVVFCAPSNCMEALKRAGGLVEPGAHTLPSWQYRLQTKEQRKVFFSLLSPLLSSLL